MKNFSIFTKEYLRYANGYVDAYLDQVESCRKQYPHLRKWELFPLLLPVGLVLSETSAGQTADYQIKSRAVRILLNADILTVLHLYTSRRHLPNYRNSGEKTTLLLTTCMDEFLVKFRINRETLDDNLTAAAKNPPRNP
jgi:hypothetical protein